MKWLATYLAVLAAFVIIDLIWLGAIAADFYKASLKGLMAEQINLTAAGVFYAIYAVGILIFAVAPALDGGGWTRALLMGALFGFFCYATYDLTGLAVIRDWPLAMSLVDIAWGAAVTGAAAMVGFFVATRF